MILMHKNIWKTEEKERYKTVYIIIKNYYLRAKELLIP